MGKLRVYAVIPRYMVARNFVREKNQPVYTRLKRFSGPVSISVLAKIVWVEVPRKAISTSDGWESVKANVDIKGWRDLTEEDMHAFLMEESLEGNRARELRLQPLHPMGRNNGSSR
jgi:hypothetical protein